MVKINWTNAAIDDLQAAHEYAQASPVFANRLIEHLVARADILANFPNAGRPVPEFGNAKIRELVEGNFRIVYRVVSRERVDITRVHHASQPLTNPG